MSNQDRVKRINELRDRYPYDIAHIREIFDSGIEFEKIDADKQIKKLEELTLEAIKHAPTMFEEAYMKRLKALKK